MVTSRIGHDRSENGRMIRMIGAIRAHAGKVAQARGYAQGDDW